MSLETVPTLNAGLNGLALLLLVSGFCSIRAGRRDLHRNLMVTAFGVSTLFLASYLYYHSQMGSVRFQGEGGIRTFYFVVLISHSLLAAAVPFLAIGTLWLGWKSRFEGHRRLARWTLPIWLYVSFTGIVVYWMLYRL